MKECRLSVARNLGFYVKDPKWLNVHMESATCTNTVQVNSNKPLSQILFADAGPGYGKLMDGLHPELRASGSGAVSGSRWFSAVDLCQSLPFSREDCVKLWVTRREMPGCSLRSVDLIRVWRKILAENWSSVGNGNAIRKKRAGTQRLRKVKHIWRYVSTSLIPKKGPFT